MSHTRGSNRVLNGRPRACLGRRRLARSAAAFAATAAATAAVTAGSAGAATQYWDPNAATGLGGTGTWDTTTPAWSNTAAPMATPVVFVPANVAYFGGTAGTVTVGSGGVDASGVTLNVSGYTIASGGTLTLDGANPNVTVTAAGTSSTTISGVVAGTFNTASGTAGQGLTLTGVSGTNGAPSNLFLTGANTYTGTTNVVTSVVQFNTLAVTGTASSFGTAGNVLIGTGSASAAQLFYTGTGGTTDRLFQFAGTSTSEFLNNNGTGPISFTGTGAAVTGTGSRLLNLGGSYTAGANTFAEAIGDAVPGTSVTSVTKVSGGVIWTLSGANTYTGPTTFTSGTLNGIGAHAFGSTSGISISGSSVLGLLGDASTTFSSATTGTPYPIVTTGSGSTINVGNATAAGTAAKTMTIGTFGTTSVATAFTVSFTGTAGDSSNLSVGAVTGPASTAAGTVTLTNSIAAATGSLTLASYTSANTTGGETLSFTGGGGNTIVSGAITPSGTSGLSVKSTVGQLSLLGSSTYAGGTLLNNGILSIGQAMSLGTGTLTVTPSSAANGLAQVNALAGLTLANPIATTVAGSSAFFRSVAPAGATFNVAGPVTGAGSVQVQTTSQSAVGPIEFSNDASSYTGTFNTGGGAVAFTSVANPGAASALGAGSGPYTLANLTTGLTLQYLGANATTTTRALALTGTTGTLNLDASGAGTVQFLSAAALRSGTGGATTLTFQGSNAGGNTLAQVVNDNGGATAVSKTGAGTWVLTGANTYTGTTSITAGTLVANGSSGSATSTSAVTVGSTTAGGVTTAGVLAGNGAAGTAAGGTVLIVAGGKITAGSGATAADSIGTLNTGLQTWNASGGYVAKVNAAGTANDQLVLSGLTTTIGTTTSPFTVTLLGQGGSAAPSPLSTTAIVIATDDATNVGVFQNAITAGSLVLATSNVSVPAGYAPTLLEADSGGTELLEVEATLSSAPEPTSLILLAVAGGPLLIGRRRRTANRRA